MFLGVWLRKAGIGRKLLTAILLFSGALTIILTGFEISAEYQQESRNLNQELESIKGHQIKPIVQATWVMDLNQQEALIEALGALPSVIYCSLYDDQEGHIATAGVLEKGYDNVEKIKLYFHQKISHCPLMKDVGH